MIKVCGIIGSLRKRSFNRGLMNAAIEIGKGEGLDIVLFDRVGDLPLFNEDLESSLPEPVLALREAISSAEGLLVATPEYNHSIPGVLKNAIDWASRPPRPIPLADKPVALIGASTGLGASIRAQMHLRGAFVQTGSPVLQKPEILVPHAQKVFDENVNLTDETTREFMRKQLIAFKEWIAKINSTEQK